MPIKAHRFEKLLKGHPNKELVCYVIASFKQGFTLKYQGPKVDRKPANLSSAYQFQDQLWNSVMKEVHLGRMLGPFNSQPIKPLICSPVGMIEKKNSTDMHWVTHLSYPRVCRLMLLFIHKMQRHIIKPLKQQLPSWQRLDLDLLWLRRILNQHFITYLWPSQN